MPHSLATRFVAQIPGARLEMLAGAGHAPWVDDPQYAAAQTRTFLSG
jgi:pimeloyl-ACP methyl ester carboxylesterase